MSQWERFRVDTDNGFIKALLDANTQGKLEPMTKPVTKPFLTPVPMPADASDMIKIRVTNTLGINLRSGPSTDYQTSGSLAKGNEVTLYQKPFRQAANGQVWRWVSVDDKIGGWCCSDVLTYDVIVVVPPPVIPDTPPALTSVYLMTAAEREQLLGLCLQITNLIIGLQESKVSQKAA